MKTELQPEIRKRRKFEEKKTNIIFNPLHLD